MHYLSLDKPLNLAALVWLSPVLIFYFSKNNIFLFFNDFQIKFKQSPLAWLHWLNTIVVTPFDIHLGYMYPFLWKGWNCDKFIQNIYPFHNQWKYEHHLCRLRLRLRLRLSQNFIQHKYILRQVHQVAKLTWWYIKDRPKAWYGKYACWETSIKVMPDRLHRGHPGGEHMAKSVKHSDEH